MEWPVLQCSLFPCHGSDTLEERDLRIFLSFPVFPHSQVPLHWDPYNKVARRRQAWSWAIFSVTLGSTANTHVWLFRGRDTLNSCSNQCDLNCPDGNCVLYQKCSFFFFFHRIQKENRSSPVLLLTTLTCLHYHCPLRPLELLRKEKVQEQRASSGRLLPEPGWVWFSVL